MKENKNLLMTFLVAISVVLLFGVDNAYAADLQITNRTVVCEKDLEVGESTLCYLVGEGNTDGSAHGFVTKVYTKDGLRLTDASGYPDKTKAYKTEPTSESVGKKTDDGIITNFICKADVGANSNVNFQYTGENQDYACVAFYSPEKQEKLFTVSNAKVRTADSILKGKLDNQGLPNLMVIGSYTVKLDDIGSKTGCGEICVKSWVIDESTGYDHYTEGPDAEGVGSVTSGGGNGKMESNQYFCAEVTIMGGEDTPLGTPETGGFISYILLIAGALIAISAVVIANKNNKIYHV